MTDSTYPDGSEINNRDEVTLHMSGIVYRRLLWTFEELDRQFKNRLARIEDEREEAYNRLRNSERPFFKAYSDADLHVFVNNQTDDNIAAVRFMRDHAREAFAEIILQDKTEVVPDPEPNKLW